MFCCVSLSVLWRCGGINEQLSLIIWIISSDLWSLVECPYHQAPKFQHCSPKLRDAPYRRLIHLSVGIFKLKEALEGVTRFRFFMTGRVEIICANDDRQRWMKNTTYVILLTMGLISDNRSWDWSHLLSVDGKKVLHMNRSDYYGGDSASLYLTQVCFTRPPCLMPARRVTYSKNNTGG